MQNGHMATRPTGCRPFAAKDGTPCLAFVDAAAAAFAIAAIARGLVTQRIEAGLTQKELARRAGVRLETVCRLEGGKQRPTRETVPRLDRALRAAGARE
jgi:DNA-binding XRE family transcriptional regulator